MSRKNKYEHNASKFKDGYCKCDICSLANTLKTSAGCSVNEANEYANLYIEKYRTDTSVKHKNFYDFIKRLQLE